MRGLKQPAGFVFNKGALCNNVVTPKSDLSSLDSALYYAQKQGVKATLRAGVVDFDDGNNEEEQKELAFGIPKIRSTSCHDERFRSAFRRNGDDGNG